MVGPERAECAGDVDDDRAGRPAQEGQRRLGDPDHAYRVRVEHRQGVRAVQREHGDARVVDEHIETAVGLQTGEGRCDRRVVGHVELHGPGAELLGDRTSPRLVAGSYVDGVPGGDELAGCFLAETSGSPGDERCCHAPTLGPPAAAQAAVQLS